MRSASLADAYQFASVNGLCTDAGGLSLCPASLSGQIADLLEFDTQYLYPALLEPIGRNLDSVLAKIEEKLVGKSYLTGDTLTVADIVIACDLLCGLPTRSGEIAAFVTRVRGTEHFVAATAKLGFTSGDDSALQQAFSASVAAFTAAKPKLPKAGERNILVRTGSALY